MQTRRPARRRRRRAVCVVLVLAIVVGIVSLAAHLRMTAALSAGQRQKLVHYAESFEGEPYESAAFTCPGIGPGLCAGYVRRVYLDTLGKERGDIGRTTAEQMQELSARSANGNGVYLTASSIRYDKSGLLQTKAMGMQLGDLIYYQEVSGPARHVGIYIGDQNGEPWMIDNNANGGVGKRKLTFTIGRADDPYHAVAVYCNP